MKGLVMIALIYLLTFGFYCTFTTALKCPEKFEKFGNTCILYEDSHKNASGWNEAQDHCRTAHNSSTLLRITSLNEQLHLTALMGKLNYPVWIGHQCDKKCDIDLVSNSSFEFCNWKRNEPNGKNLRCVMVYQRETNIGEWNDEICTKKHGFICQASPIDDSESTNNDNDVDLLLHQGNCSNGFIEFNDACYSIINSSTPVDTLNEVEVLCKKQHARAMPLVVHTEPEAALIRLILTLPGINDANLTKIWTGYQIIKGAMEGLFHYYSHVIKSPDESSLGFDELLRPIDRLKKYEIGNETLCLVFNISNLGKAKTYLTFLDNCSGQKDTLAACVYYEKNNSMHEYNKELFPCPLGYESFGSKCLKYEFESNNFTQSNVKCGEQYNGTLVTIHNMAEQKFVSNLAGLQKAWIGLSYNSENKDFLWIDNSPVNYWQFRAGEPSQHFDNMTGEHCVELRGRSAEWNDNKCDTLNPRICQIIRACPSGYSLVPKYGCVKIVNLKKNLSDAWQHCQKESADLLSFENESFYSSFKKIPSMQEEHYWIGLISIGKRNLITWLDSVDTKFAKSNIFVNSDSTLLNCYSIRKDKQQSFSFESQSCNIKLPFICKKNFNTLSKFNDCPQPEKDEIKIGSICLKKCNDFACLNQTDITESTTAETATSTEKPDETSSKSNKVTTDKSKITKKPDDTDKTTIPQKIEKLNTSQENQSLSGKSPKPSGRIWPLVLSLVVITILLAGLVLFWRYRDRIRLFRGAGNASGGGTSFYNPIYSPLDVNQSL